MTFIQYMGFYINYKILKILIVLANLLLFYRVSIFLDRESILVHQEQPRPKNEIWSKENKGGATSKKKNQSYFLEIIVFFLEL